MRFLDGLFYGCLAGALASGAVLIGVLLVRAS